MVKVLAVAALRVVAGKRSTQSTSPGTAATAVKVAASWLPEGTPEALALAVTTRLHHQGQSEEVVSDGCSEPSGADVTSRSVWRRTQRGAMWLQRSATAAAALAVAAHQQPLGTFEGRELAAAAGQALLQERRGVALGLAAKQLGPDVASLAAVTGRVLHVAYIRRAGQQRQTAALQALLPPRLRGLELPRPQWGARSGPHLCTLQDGCRGAVGPASLGPWARTPLQILAPGLAVLCRDTSGRVIETLWPPKSAENKLADDRAWKEADETAAAEVSRMPGSASLSPRTFERRLRQAAPILHDLQQVSAVSPTWAQLADEGGWPAAHDYLYREPGSKGELRRRYAASVQRLLVKDWMRRPGRPQNWDEGLVSHIVAFMP